MAEPLPGVEMTEKLTNFLSNLPPQMRNARISVRKRR